jgi:bleomycin hydrolase
MIDLADSPLDSRLVQHLLSQPIGDGGQFDMVIVYPQRKTNQNLVQKYGVIPHAVYPDTYSAIASARLNWLLTTKLRENALVLREIQTSGTDQSSAMIAKAKMMEEIYGAMVLAFGKPPKPNDTFEWTYADKDEKYHRIKTTPLDFYKSVEFKAEDHFSLINDPRNEYSKLYTVDRLKNGTLSLDSILNVISFRRSRN